MPPAHQVAANQAKALKADILANGADPRGEEKARKEVVTLTTLFNDFYFPYKLPRKRSIKRDREIFSIRLQKAFGDRQISSLRHQEIAAWHTVMAGDGSAPATVDNALKLLKHMLNLAID